MSSRVESSLALDSVGFEAIMGLENLSGFFRMPSSFRRSPALGRRAVFLYRWCRQEKGHDIMALERFDPEVRHMVVFDVLSFESPVGYKGDKMRLFLTDEGYQKTLENQERGFIKIKNHAKVHNGYLNYDHKDRAL